MKTMDVDDLDQPAPVIEPKEPKPEPPRLQPIQRPWRASAVALVGLFVLAILYTLYFARDVFLPITLAWILNLLLKPTVRLLKSWRIPVPLGAAIILIGFLGTVGGGLYLISEPASVWLAKAPETFHTAGERIRETLRPAQKIQKAASEMEKFQLESPVEGEPKTQQVELKRPGLMNSFLSKTTDVLFLIAETIVLLYFMMASGDLLMLKAIQALPRFKDKKRLVEIVNETEQQVSRYLGAVTVVNAIEGTLIGIGLAMVGMPNPVLWGVLAAVVNYIPYLGAMICVGCIALVSLVTFDSLGHALLPPAIYLFINISDNFIAPMFLGKQMVLNPLVIFIALLFWGWIWGITGAIIAVPLTMAFKVFCDHFAVLAPVGELLAGAPETPKPEAAA
jgi:predicted PurR-regulated permease PerM